MGHVFLIADRHRIMPAGKAVGDDLLGVGLAIGYDFITHGMLKAGRGEIGCIKRFIHRSAVRAVDRNCASWRWKDSAARTTSR